ncbi:MAG TPA: mechanosensitive ion channel family protein [Crocinitomicaceae bacterium]|nr:mechanosensitive ion channel family protein [Crocinitomicaceae bacterium]
MKDFLNKEFYSNTISEWLISFGIILGAIIIAKILYWFIGKFVKKIALKTKTSLDDILVDQLEEPIVYGIGLIGFYWGVHRLEFGSSGDVFFDHLFIVLLAIIITWLFARVVDSLIEEYIVPIVSKSDSDLDDQLLPVIRKTLKTGIWILGIVIGMNNAGFDVAALIAGLGIGGIALAFAAQDTIKNIFGGIMVFLDKPFKMKDRIKINGWDGEVEEIGVRSTRLRTLEGRLVTIPNGQFSDHAIENVTLEPSRKVKISLGLTYETTPDQMERAMELLKEIAISNPNVEDKDIFISFNSWGDFSMGILFIYFMKKDEDIFTTQSEMNMEILKRFNGEGLEFAYPTSVVYRK